MCELFGISAASPVDAADYLRAFFSHSVRHPHGWGLMREHGRAQEVVKEPVRAIGSRIIDNVIRKTPPQTNMLAHIRLATIGGTKYDNCHPYTGTDLSGRQWTLIHNGTIYSGTQLVRYLPRQVGDTDSERIFLYLIDEVNTAINKSRSELTQRQRFDIVDRLAAALSPRNKLNFIIYDGELMYVHKNMRNSLFRKQLPDGVILSTEPLDDGEWAPMPLTQVIAYRNGEKAFSGTQHKHEFIPTLEYITALDAMNI